MALLSVGAAINDVGIGEASTPHHEATKRRVALILSYQLRELVRGNVVGLSSGTAVSCQRCGWDTEGYLRAGRRSVGNEGHPVVVVERGIAVKSEGARNCIVIVVIKLDKEIVKLGGADDFSHIGLGNWALRCSCAKSARLVLEIELLRYIRMWAG